MPPLLIATTNAGKIREIRHLLAHWPDLRTLADLPPIAEPEETGATFAENAALKAVYYARSSAMVTVAEDSGLVIGRDRRRARAYTVRGTREQPTRTSSTTCTPRSARHRDRGRHGTCVPSQWRVPKSSISVKRRLRERSGTNRAAHTASDMTRSFITRRMGGRLAKWRTRTNWPWRTGGARSGNWRTGWRLLRPNGFVEAEEQQTADYKPHDGNVLRHDQDVDEASEQPAEQCRDHLAAKPFHPDRTTAVPFRVWTEAAWAGGHSGLGGGRRRIVPRPFGAITALAVF